MCDFCKHRLDSIDQIQVSLNQSNSILELIEMASSQGISMETLSGAVSTARRHIEESIKINQDLQDECREELAAEAA